MTVRHVRFEIPALGRNWHEVADLDDADPVVAALIAAGRLVTAPGTPGPAQSYHATSVIYNATTPDATGLPDGIVWAGPGGLSLLQAGAWVPLSGGGGLTPAQLAATPELRAAYVSPPQVLQAQRLSTSTDLATAAVASPAAPFGGVSSMGANAIVVDPTEVFQPFLGAGAALTDSAAYCLLTYLTDAQRQSLLTEMFSPAQNNFSLLRIAFGSTDFQQTAPYTYDEVGTGQTDPNLFNFSIAKDTTRIIPLLRQILAINPGLKIFASVWHPPSWMLTTPANNFNTTSMSIATGNLTAYANYLVQCIQAYKSYGIPIYALSYANECEPGNKFAMPITDQQTLIKALGAALETAGLEDVKLVSHDGQWNNESVIAEPVLGDATALAYVDGVAFHGYAGTPATAQEALRRFSTRLAIYSTEWRSLAAESADTTMRGMAGGWIVESIENWSRGVMLWNLALDENGRPATTATGRRGVVTIPSSGSGAVVRNQEFYALAHLTRWVKPGARRCGTAGPPRGPKYTAYQTYPSTLKRVAFVNPDGSVVLYIYNGSGAAVTCQIVDARSNQSFPATINAGDVATFVWGTNAQLTPGGTPSSATPQAVTPTAAVSAGTVALTWATPGGASVTGYTVNRGGTRIGMVPAGTTSFTDYVTAGTYSYTVTTETLAGTATSTAVPATVAAAATAPGAPTLAVATSPSGGFQLTWNAVAANGSPLTGYTVSRATSSGAETQLASVAPGYTSYSDGAVNPGTTYYYTVSAVNSVGSTVSNEANGVINGAYIDHVTVGPAPTSTATTSVTFAHTVSAGLSNTYLIAAIGSSAVNASNNEPVFSSVTYGGVAMTKIARVSGNPGQSSNRLVELWALVNPTAGTANVVATINGLTGSTQDYMYPAAVSFAGVNQTTPLGTPATLASASTASASLQTTSGATKDLVLGLATARTTTNPITVGASQISEWELNKGDNTQFVGTIQAGGAGTITSTFSWPSADVVAAIAVAIKGA